MYLAKFESNCAEGSSVTAAWENLRTDGYVDETDFDDVAFYEIGKPLEVVRELRVVPVKKGS